MEKKPSKPLQDWLIEIDTKDRKVKLYKNYFREKKGRERKGTLPTNK